jgi:hypothetical protein
MQTDQLKRRDFITLLGGAAVARPLAARAQQQTMPVVGFLSSLSQNDLGLVIPGFLQGLNGAGLIEGLAFQRAACGTDVPTRAYSLGYSLAMMPPAVSVTITMPSSGACSGTHKFANGASAARKRMFSASHTVSPSTWLR